MAYQKKSYKKFVATAASATLVASAIVPVVSAASFSDVEETHEFATYIDAAVEAGYINGYADGTFGINDNLKRSQVVIIIGRYLESLGYTSEATTSPWSDVTDKEVIKYGNILKDAGVFTGYADGTLKGNDFITRENMAVVLDRLAEVVTGVSFSDVAEEIEDVKIADLATANAAYQASIQALRDLEISTADNFNPKGNVKRGQFAKFIVTAIEIINAIAEESTELEVESAIALNETTIEVTFTDGTVVEYELDEPLVEGENELTIEHEGVEYTIIVEYVGELAVESVNAIGAKKIEVKFTAPVDAKSTFELKKGSAKVNTESVTLSADNKTAVIELSGKMTEGTYTVNVTSGEEKLEGSVKVENEKVDSIEILSENAVLNDTANNTSTASTATVSVGYQVKNQYGEDITKTTSLIANAAGATTTGATTITQSKSIVTIGVDSTKVKEGDAITLTLVHGETGVSATKVLKVSAKSQVAEITLKSLYNKDGKTLTETTDLTKDKFYVLVDAVDQYGNAVTADKLVTSGTGQNVVLNETNTLVADVNNTFETITVDGQEKVALQLNSPLTVGETTVMAIATSTGKNSSLKITVAEGQRANTAVINTPELVVAGEKTFVPIEVTDKEGNVIKDVKVLKDSKRGVTLSGGSVTTSNWTTKDGQTGVYLDLTGETEASYKSIVAVTSSNQNAIANIQVKEAAKPVRVDGVTKAVKTTLLMTDETKITLDAVKVIDQYERELTKAQKDDLFADGDYVLEVNDDKPNAGEGAIDIAEDGTVTPVAKGTEKVTITLHKKEGEGYPLVSGSEKTIEFRVTDGREYVSYEVEKIGNIFDEVGAGLTDSATNGYAKEVKVYGVLDNGSKVELTVGTDYSVDAPSWLGGTSGILNPTATPTPTVTSNVPYATNATEVKADVTVTINATGDQFTEKVTVSKVKPTVTSVKVVAEKTVEEDKVYSSAAEKAQFAALTEVTEVNFTSSMVAENVDFAVVDSYGVMRVLDNATASTYLPAIKLVVKPNTAHSLTITDNNSAQATISGWTASDFVTVTASVNGLEKSFQISGDQASQSAVAAIERLASDFNTDNIDDAQRKINEITDSILKAQLQSELNNAVGAATQLAANATGLDGATDAISSVTIKQESTTIKLSGDVQLVDEFAGFWGPGTQPESGYVALTIASAKADGTYTGVQIITTDENGNDKAPVNFTGELVYGVTEANQATGRTIKIAWDGTNYIEYKLDFSGITLLPLQTP